MEHHQLPFSDTNAFSKSFLDYISGVESLREFYNRQPSIDSFKAQIEERLKSFPEKNRQVLTAALSDQYKEIELTDRVETNIKLLADTKTFTVTTGHQLNLCTGPLYFIYKIVTVINLAKKLKSTYPDYDFVPVYWMASEDHDFAEICYFRLYGKKYSWRSEQSGAVGRFNPKELKALLADVPGDNKIFDDAYSKHNTLADAVRFYVNQLFGQEGLVVVDADSRELKSLFSDIIHDDVQYHNARQLVDQTNSELEKLGHKTQVHARDINFFYLEEGLRSRLERVGDEFVVVDTDLKFSRSQLEELINNEPEKFSPNVVLRPVYEEVILPNLAYIGGPAEVVYWLQLKRVFDHYKVPFPVLVPRNFALVIDAPTNRKFKKTGLKLHELFLGKNDLHKLHVRRFAKNKIELNGEKEAIERYFESIREHAETFDKTLGPLVGAETRRAIKSLEKIEQKLFKAEKRNQADKLNQVDAVKDALFPNGSPQERTDNFLNFYHQDKDFIAKLIDKFDPLDFRFNVFTYND